MEIIYKPTHAIINDGGHFSTVSKKTRIGTYEVHTNVKLMPEHADKIEALNHSKQTVLVIDFFNGFIRIKPENDTDFNDIVEAVVEVLHEKN